MNLLNFYPKLEALEIIRSESRLCYEFALKAVRFQFPKRDVQALNPIPNTPQISQSDYKCIECKQAMKQWHAVFRRYEYTVCLNCGYAMSWLKN